MLRRRTTKISCRAAEVPLTADTWENVQSAIVCRLVNFIAVVMPNNFKTAIHTREELTLACHRP
jgi:hypothetical protein